MSSPRVMAKDVPSFFKGETEPTLRAAGKSTLNSDSESLVIKTVAPSPLHFRTKPSVSSAVEKKSCLPSPWLPSQGANAIQQRFVVKLRSDDGDVSFLMTELCSLFPHGTVFDVLANLQITGALKDGSSFNLNIKESSNYSYIAEFNCSEDSQTAFSKFFQDFRFSLQSSRTLTVLADNKGVSQGELKYRQISPDTKNMRPEDNQDLDFWAASDISRYEDCAKGKVSCEQNSQLENDALKKSTDVLADADLLTLLGMLAANLGDVQLEALKKLIATCSNVVNTHKIASDKQTIPLLVTLAKSRHDSIRRYAMQFTSLLCAQPEFCATTASLIPVLFALLLPTSPGFDLRTQREVAYALASITRSYAHAVLGNTDAVHYLSVLHDMLESNADPVVKQQISAIIEHLCTCDCAF